MAAHTLLCCNNCAPPGRPLALRLLLAAAMRCRGQLAMLSGLGASCREADERETPLERAGCWVGGTLSVGDSFTAELQEQECVGKIQGDCAHGALKPVC